MRIFFLWEMIIISSISSYNRFTYSERNCLYCISDFFKCVTKLAKKGKSVFTNFFFVLESHLFAIIKVNYSKQYWSGYNFCVLNILWCKCVKCQKTWKSLDIWCVHKKLEEKNLTPRILVQKKKIIKDKLLYFVILWESQNLWYWLRLLSSASVCFYLNCQSNSISKYVNFIVCKENFFLLL